MVPNVQLPSTKPALALRDRIGWFGEKWDHDKDHWTYWVGAVHLTFSNPMVKWGYALILKHWINLLREAVICFLPLRICCISLAKLDFPHLLTCDLPYEADNDSSYLTTFSSGFSCHPVLHATQHQSNSRGVWMRNLGFCDAWSPLHMTYWYMVVVARIRRLVLTKKSILKNRWTWIELARDTHPAEAIKFHGHIFGSEGLKPDPAKESAIINMPVPEDKAGVHGPLGHGWLSHEICPTLVRFDETFERSPEKWHRVCMGQ